MKFKGRTALVTGSGTGIGQTVVKRFVENGASVILLGRRREPLEETAGILNQVIGRIGSGASVRIFSGVDVADEADVNGMFDALKEDRTSLDYVINNAGVSGPVKCFASASMDDFKSTVGIHLTGTFWTSVRALDVISPGGKIITISTFFTEERPLEQRPYRFRSPYTASQGAKNRLAEAMSWELAERGIVSIATNPGPVHSDRIYKTVYPKAASEFMRVSGFEGLSPEQVDAANGMLVDLLGEDEGTVKSGIAGAADALAGQTGRSREELGPVLDRLLKKIQAIAEKIQRNTSHMIADKQFLSQDQVAEMVLNLCDDGIAGMLNGKVVPGDRVFYPVRPHVGTTAPAANPPDLAGRSVVFTVQTTGGADVRRALSLASHVEKNGGRAVCLISQDTPQEHIESISKRFHSHTVDTSDPGDVRRWLNAAHSKMGPLAAVVHMTGNMPEIPRLTALPRSQWDGLVNRFITSTAVVSQEAIGLFVPGGDRDPRLFRDAQGAVIIIGPDMPAGRISGVRRAQIEVFRGALRPFTATVNQELSDVLKSRVRVFSVFAGSVAGTEPDDERMADVLDFALSGDAASSAVTSFCVDESR